MYIRQRIKCGNPKNCVEMTNYKIFPLFLNIICLIEAMAYFTQGQVLYKTLEKYKYK